jgi:NitT/TauT family transport system permease protein
MKKLLYKFLIPFEGNGKDNTVKWISLIVIPIIIWLILPNNIFPPILNILGAIPSLLKKNDLIENFSISLIFCIKSMLYASVIAFLFMLVARIPLFQAFAIFCRKFRFLPSVGLSFLFMKLTPDVSSMMSWMMIFGITTFMVDGAVGIALSVSKDDVNYAKSLRLSRWEIFRELIIYSKLPVFFIMAVSNFAIAWMLLASIENIAKSSGGIGVVLAESNKYFKLENIYAIQLLILFAGIAIDWLLNNLINWWYPYINLKKA